MDGRLDSSRNSYGGPLADDRRTVEFALRRFDAPNVLLRGSAPPGTFYGGSKPVFSPYPAIADQIVKQIERLR